MKGKDKVAKVFLDTNFLLIPYQCHVDIFSEIERVLDVPYGLIVLQHCVDELEKMLQSGVQSERLGAKLALELVKARLEPPKGIKCLFSGLKEPEKQKNLKIAGGSCAKHTDDAILEAASSEDFVATLDKELKKRLKRKNIKIITLKQRKYLIVE